MNRDASFVVRARSAKVTAARVKWISYAACAALVASASCPSQAMAQVAVAGSLVADMWEEALAGPDNTVWVNAVQGGIGNFSRTAANAGPLTVETLNVNFKGTPIALKA